MLLRERLLQLYRQAHADKLGQRLAVPADLQRLGMRYFAPRVEANQREAVVTVSGGDGQARAADGDEPPAGERVAVTAVINTNEIDRYGTIVEPAGCRSDNFKRNPVLLWAHGHDNSVGTIPIGEVKELRITPQAIEADVLFDDDDPGRGFGEKYAKKKLRGFSIGFLPVTMSLDMVDGKEVVRFIEWELVELSAVGVPANPSCLARDIDAGEFHFDSKIVSESFEAVCECVARGDDPELLLCRVLDVAVPEPGNSRTAPAAVPATHSAAGAAPVVVLENEGESLAARSVSDADPLGLGFLAQAQAQLGGTPQAIPGPATGAPVAGSADAGQGGFTQARFAAAAQGAAPAGAVPAVATPARTQATAGAGIAPAATSTTAPETSTEQRTGCGCGTAAAPAATTSSAPAATAVQVNVTGVAEPTALARELDTLLAGAMSPELRAQLTALRPTIVVVTQADAPDWRGIWSTEAECRGANPEALPLMAAATAEVNGQPVRFFVHHRAADGALSVTGLMASMRELIGESHNLTREALGEAYDHLAAHYKELGIACPEARPHTPGECYDLALRGVVTHYHGGHHYLFDRAEQRDINGGKHFLPIFRSIETGTELAFQPPAIGRLENHELWGRRDLEAPTGNEALLQRLLDTQTQLLALNERVGAKFSQATRTRMAAMATGLGDAVNQMRSCVDAMETVARDINALLGDGSDDASRSVSAGGTAAPVSGSNAGTATGDQGDEEFVRNLRRSVDASLSEVQKVCMAERRAARAQGVSAIHQ